MIVLPFKQDQVSLVENLRQDYESQQQTMNELRYLLCQGEGREGTLDSQLQEVRGQLERLQQESLSLISERKRVGTENSELRDRCTSQEGLLFAVKEQMERSVT